ncbi:MAG: response regulator transcription factor [Candidatus Spyradosoma sp.]
MKLAKPRILVVEDDEDLLRFLVGVLRLRGYEVCAARTFPEACRCADEEPFSLALLDVLLPGGGSGIDVLRRIRKTRGNVPAIMQTALGDDEYCVRCLNAGADDFVVKPVRQGPLIARIEAVLRRASGTPDPLEKIPLGRGAQVFSPRREIRFADGRITRLTHKEMRLLRYLRSRGNEPATLPDLLLNVWDASPALVDSACVPALVARLRRKLEGVARIRSLYGNGYALEIGDGQADGR